MGSIRICRINVTSSTLFALDTFVSILAFYDERSFLSYDQAKTGKVLFMHQLFLARTTNKFRIFLEQYKKKKWQFLTFVPFNYPMFLCTF